VSRYFTGNGNCGRQNAWKLRCSFPGCPATERYSIHPDRTIASVTINEHFERLGWLVGSTDRCDSCPVHARPASGIGHAHVMSTVRAKQFAQLADFKLTPKLEPEPEPEPEPESKPEPEPAEEPPKAAVDRFAVVLTELADAVPALQVLTRHLIEVKQELRAAVRAMGEARTDTRVAITNAATETKLDFAKVEKRLQENERFPAEIAELRKEMRTGAAETRAELSRLHASVSTVIGNTSSMVEMVLERTCVLSDTIRELAARPVLATPAPLPPLPPTPEPDLEPEPAAADLAIRKTNMKWLDHLQQKLRTEGNGRIKF
jgi:hypothetical protein